jgi:hypothetical protein
MEVRMSREFFLLFKKKALILKLFFLPEIILITDTSRTAEG